jgi:ubiquitin C-terminal hydrolase
MYGQLKSTVRCLECGNVSITFDPMNVFSLPIMRPSMFSASLVPYEIYRKAKEDSDEEDPDYKSESKLTLTEHFKF